MSCGHLLESGTATARPERRGRHEHGGNFGWKRTERILPGGHAFDKGQELMARDFEHATQLGNWIGMLIDAQTEIRIGFGLMNQHGSRLPAALVATGALTGLESDD